MAVQLAARSIDIPAAVSFYGKMTKFRGRKNLRTEFLYHVPDNDNRFTKQLHDYETQLIDAKIQYTIHRYRDTNSGFFNDATPKRYNEEEAELAWTRSIELLKDKLIDKRFDFR